MAGPLTIELLGTLAISSPQGRVEADAQLGAHGRTLLARLLHEPDRVASREVLAEALWSGDLPTTWETMLRNAASRVRTFLAAADLGRETLAAEGGTYVLRLPLEAVVDVDTARAAEARARELVAADPAAAAALAGEAVDLLRRPLLPGLAGDWVEALQDDLLRVQLRALESLAEASLASGEPDRARRAAEDMIAVEPFRESAYRIVMEAYALSGNRAEAIRAYSACRTLLDEELGMHPSPETEAVFLRLLGGAAPDPSTVAPAALPVSLPFPPGLADATPARLIGRVTEWETIRRAWDVARAGEPRLVLVGGDPGIGKSALASSIARELHEDGALVLYGRTDEDVEEPYRPLAGALGPLARTGAGREFAETGGDRALTLSRIVPELEPVAGMPVARAGELVSDQRELQEAAAWWLCRLAEPAGLVLVLDDLHWADRSTLELIRQIALGPASARLLVIGTYRIAEPGATALEEILPELLRPARTSELRLRGLAEAEVGELVCGTTGHAGAPLVHALWSDTGGNPFHVRELLRDLQERGALAAGEDALSGGSALGPLEVPETVRSVLRRRLVRLGARTVEALTTASVVGLDFDIGVLAAANEGEDDVLDAVAEAEAARLIVPVRDTPGSYRFAHSLVRRALYDDLDGVGRMRRHRRVGQALEDAGPPEANLAALAHHFYEAAPLGARQAVAYARWAGDRALAAVDFASAATQYERALTALGLDPRAEPAERCDLMTAYGDALRRSGAPEHREVLFSAGALAREIGDAVRLARAALVLVRRGIAQRAGRADEELIALVDDAVARLGSDQEATLLRARLLSGLAAAVMYTPAEHRRPDLGRAARTLIPVLESPEDALGVLVNDYYASFDPDSLDERFARHDDVTRLAERLGDQEAVGLVSLYRHADLLERGEPDAAGGALARAEVIAADLPQASWLAWRVAVHRAGHVELTGDPAEAEALADVALDVGRTRGVPMSRVEVTHLFQRLAVRTRQGRALELEPAVLRTVDTHPGYPILRVHACLLAAEAGRCDDAHARLRALLHDLDRLPRNTYWLGTMMLTAQAASACSDADAARSVCARLAPYRGRGSWTGSVSHGPVDAVLLAA